MIVYVWMSDIVWYDYIYIYIYCMNVNMLEVSEISMVKETFENRKDSQ